MDNYMINTTYDKIHRKMLGDVSYNAIERNETIKRYLVSYLSKCYITSKAYIESDVDNKQTFIEHRKILDTQLKEVLELDYE